MREAPKVCESIFVLDARGEMINYFYKRIPEETLWFYMDDKKYIVKYKEDIHHYPIHNIGCFKYTLERE